MNNFSLDDFFAAFKNLRAGRTQSCGGFQSVQRGCCQQQGYLPAQAFDMPDQDVRFDCSWGCGQPQMPVQQHDCCCQPQPQPQPQQGCGNRFKDQFNMNTGIIDGPGNDIYDAPGDDVYAFGNRGIIDTDGNDIYARNYSINTFNTVNNFYRFETPTQSVTPPKPTVTPPDPSVEPEPVSVNLTPLRNLLTGIEKLQPDGVLSDAELNKAMSNPHYADMDGDPNAISAEEMAIFNKIKALNEDKNLLTNVMKGDYSNISDEQMTQLGEISAAIQELTQRR